MNELEKLNIAICDDDKQVTDQMEQWIKKFFHMNHLTEPNLYICGNGEELLSNNVKYDFAFLDVEMPGLSGIYTGKYILEQSPECLIFIITSYEEYIDEALKFHAFRYITKPIDQIRLYRNMRDAIKIYTTSNTKIMIETKKENIVVRAPEIIYFEAQGHTLFVNTYKEKYISVKKMDYWENTLNMNYFFRTHRSYIVNMEHVVRFDHTLVYLDNGDTAYLTKRNYQNFKHAFMMYLEGAKA
ncbi:MAG: response regulator transcription factor [Coprococcus sp.]|nr:response regulator transcription factor [Coprococcus sp.]